MEVPRGTVTLKPGREKPVRQRHPWIFSGAIARISPEAEDGDLVDVRAADGAWLAQGFLNRRSQIQVRILTWQEGETVDEHFWRRRLLRAVDVRRPPVVEETTDACRLVNGESDFLPGLVVDRYADWLVFQAGTLAMDRRKRMLAALLLEITGAQGVVERSDMTVRRMEGLPESREVLAGVAPPNPVTIREAGHRFLVDLERGQKTGFYLDQRVNRQRVAVYCRDRTVLNGFAYTGGFAVHALAAGARHVTNVDTSGDVLRLAAENLRLNGFDAEGQAETVVGDLFQLLRLWQTEGRRFDVIVLDPPKFASRRSHLDRALRGYKDINLQAFKLLRPGGILATFSCSGLVDPPLFQKVVFGAALDAGRQVQILEWLRQAPDHPVALTFPEGAYLKGLICRVVY